MGVQALAWREKVYGGKIDGILVEILDHGFVNVYATVG